MAEGIRMAGESCAKFSGGSYMAMKWADIIDPKPVETRAPEQIIDHVLGRLKEVNPG